MTSFEIQALDRIATCQSADTLRQYLVNAKGSSASVHRAALERLVAISVSDHSDPVARDCWAMVHTIEELRRDAGRKVWRMHRLRPKIDREGERAALEYCARRRTDGFDEVLEYGLPHLTAEAIVLRYPEVFPAEVLAAARSRLIEAGVDPMQP